MLTLGIAPACDCWRVDFTAIQSVWARPPNEFPQARLQVPDFRFNFTISKFGSIGSR
jgi:hypothetical protein